LLRLGGVAGDVAAVDSYHGVVGYCCTSAMMSSR
jgi:hypothetical protein